jgi:hypothetical protein
VSRDDVELGSTTMPLRVDSVFDVQEDPRLRLPFRRGGFGSGFTFSALTIVDATECAVCSSFLSAMTEARPG